MALQLWQSARAYKDGEPILYTVVENPIIVQDFTGVWTSYVTTYTWNDHGYDIVNTHVPEKTL